MAIDKLIYLAILSVVGIFVFRKMINPARGPRYHLKTILFVMGVKEIPKKTELGGHIFTSKVKRKRILPWEFDVWEQDDLFENGIVLRRYKKEKSIFFNDLYTIEPLLIHPLFIKGKYFGYVFECIDRSNLTLNSRDLCDLNIFINELCLLFPSEKGGGSCHGCRLKNRNLAIVTNILWRW